MIDPIHWTQKQKDADAERKLSEQSLFVILIQQKILTTAKFIALK